MSNVILRYSLSELPSSQHRAGLVGLVEILRWRSAKKIERGVAKLIRLEGQQVEVELDQEGLEDLFNIIYAATEEERAVDRPYKNKEKKEIPPKRIEEREVADPKTKKIIQKTLYIYPEIVPKGAFLLDREPGKKGSDESWIKLWRDMIWGIMRGVPATRKPFEVRASGETANDAKDMWRALNTPKKSIDLPSTYFLGAQAKTAEGTGFKDQSQNLFLLHFWPFIAQIYQPQEMDAEGKKRYVGYAIAIPDVTNVEDYVEEIKDLLLSRSSEKAGYRPRQAVIDVPIEGALDTMARLSQVIQKRASRRVEDLVLGFDVLHVEKEGNNVRLRSVERIWVDQELVDPYLSTKELWSPVFRRQLIMNIVSEKAQWTGFASLCSQSSIGLTFGSYQFRHDAFLMLKRASERNSMEKVSIDGKRVPRHLEQIIFEMAKRYVNFKVEKKEGVTWKSEDQRDEYAEGAEKTAKKAFLAIRSRTGSDFVEYFTSTLCSIPHFISQEEYVELSKQLLGNPEQIRTLALLALSAAGYIPRKTEKKAD